MDRSALPPGTRLGEIEILRVIAVGGFGIVYLARDRSLDREVAVKEFMPTHLVSRGSSHRVSLRADSNAETYALALQSFIDEARLLARFAHPSVVKVHRCWKANGTGYMAMPYLRGPTLGDLRRSMSNPPTERWLRSTLDPLLDALELLHAEGVFHRDIAPDNVLLNESGQPVLLDFGAARHLIADRSQAPTAIIKPRYAPIEQYAEAGHVRQGPWTDLYGLGALVAFLIDGTPPPVATVRSVHDEREPLAARSIPGITPRFLAAIDWALEVKPKDRPQCIDEFRAALEGRRLPPIRLLAQARRTAAAQAALRRPDPDFPVTQQLVPPLRTPRQAAAARADAAGPTPAAEAVAAPEDLDGGTPTLAASTIATTLRTSAERRGRAKARAPRRLLAGLLSGAWSGARSSARSRTASGDKADPMPNERPGTSGPALPSGVFRPPLRPLPRALARTLAAVALCAVLAWGVVGTSATADLVRHSLQATAAATGLHAAFGRLDATPAGAVLADDASRPAARDATSSESAPTAARTTADATAAATGRVGDPAATPTTDAALAPGTIRWSAPEPLPVDASAAEAPVPLVKLSPAPALAPALARTPRPVATGARDNTTASRTDAMPVPLRRASDTAAPAASDDEGASNTDTTPARAAPHTIKTGTRGTWSAPAPTSRSLSRHGAVAKRSATPARVAMPGPIELCAERNFLFRSFCVQRRCDEPRFRSHPQCVEQRRQLADSGPRADRY